MEIKSLTLKPERREMDGVYFAPTTISFCRGVNVFTYMQEEYEKSMREDYEKYLEERFGQ